MDSANIQSRGAGLLMEATVVSGRDLCRENRRLTLALPPLEGAHPGQFLHLGRPADCDAPASGPFLRRAFSIGGLRRNAAGCEVDLIYGVRGVGTRWLASLRSGDRLSVLGPLGRGFEIVPSKPHAWLVAGGVGLAPMLWLAEWLQRAGKAAVAFYGARTHDRIPLTVRDRSAVPTDGKSAVPAAEEFTRFQTPVVLSTDDGSLGLPGTVGDCLAAYRRAWTGDDGEVVVYACGPEAMLAAVSKWCMGCGVECYVCAEREMACGMGVCQSCVVRVRDAEDREGWRYALCCTEGPVFAARDVIWT